MKKKLIISLFVFMSVNLVSYADYFSMVDKSNGNSLYGRIKLKDFTSGNVFIQTKDSETHCDGFWFVKNVSMGISKDQVYFAKVKCGDGRMMELNWKPMASGEAVDQYKNTYTINTIKKKEYKKNVKKHGKVKNEKNL